MKDKVRHADPEQHFDFEVVARAFDRVLRPIIRILIGRMSCSFLLEVVRRIYIDEAREKLARKTKGKVKTAELALLTGEQAETIDTFERFREALKSSGGRNTHDTKTVNRIWKIKNPHSTLNFVLESNIMEQWRSNPRFLDSSGKPRELPIAGTGASFNSLVDYCSGGDASADLIEQLLINLRESGTIEVLDDNHVRMLHPWYQAWKPHQQVMLGSGSNSLSRLAGTVSHNLNAGNGPRLLQRDRWSRRVRKQDLDKLQGLCAASTEKHIAEIEQILGQFEQYDYRPEYITFGVGWYHWQVGNGPI